MTLVNIIFSEAVAAVNPFKIPKVLENDFLNDYMGIVEDMSFIDKVNNNVNDSMHISAEYTLIVAFARK